MSAKTVTSAVDFIAGLTGEPELFEVEGLVVKIRSLTYAEVARINKEFDGNNFEMTFQSAKLGLVEPKLNDEQLEQLRAARPGPITAIAKRVLEMSGLGGDSNGPLAVGGGSSA